TAARVAAGAIARRLLKEFGIEIGSHLTNLGGITVNVSRPSLRELVPKTEESPLRCLDPEAETRMIQKIDEAKKSGDSLGGVFEIIVQGVPPGLGSHVQWDRKLDGQIAQALMSLQAIKGVEIGLGFEMANLFGSEVHDELFYRKKEKRFYRNRNNAGGLEGGMTNGEEIVIRAAMKPLSTLHKPLRSVNIITKEPYEASVERTDTTAVPAAAVIGENIVAVTLANVFLEKFGGDSLDEIRRNYKGYLRQIDDY
ncbi:MAG: chorismate synthase, partial [Deltaproteobacteria bacterium]|nr:chorismate synthase [Deltaproteobacteria bacterium]